MPTKNPRINVTFDEETSLLIQRIAQHQQQPIAALVRELALEALELREDFYLSKLAEKRDVKGAKTHSHEKAWK